MPCPAAQIELSSFGSWRGNWKISNPPIGTNAHGPIWRAFSGCTRPMPRFARTASGRSKKSCSHPYRNCSSQRPGRTALPRPWCAEVRLVSPKRTSRFSCTCLAVLASVGYERKESAPSSRTWRRTGRNHAIEMGQNSMSWKRVCSESASVIVALGVCLGVHYLYMRAWHVGYRVDAFGLLGSHFLRALLILVAAATVISGLQGLASREAVARKSGVRMLDLTVVLVSF